MSDEYKGIIEEDLGVQDDGEPIAVPGPETPEAPPAPEGEVSPEGEVKSEDAPPEQPHKKTGSQRARERADREAALRLEAERERDELRARLEAASKPPAADPDEPALENFETLEAWKAALVVHAQKKAAELAKKEFEAQQQQKTMQDVKRKWQEADEKFAANTPDWDDAIEDLTDAVRLLPPECEPGFNAIGAALNTSEIAPAIKYHLGKNPAELRRIAALDPIAAIKEVARLEARLSEPNQPKPPSKAPAPLRPVSGAATATPDVRFSGIEEF